MEDLEEEQDVTAWVNGVLSEASADGASVDAKISSVSMKLQIMAADLNDELEAHMEELIEAAPRALGDVGSVSRALAAVDEEAVRSARPTARARRPRGRAPRLGVADAFLNRSGAGVAALGRAAAGDVAAQLATMGDSERILRKLPDADDRRSTLDGLARDDDAHALRRAVGARRAGRLRRGAAGRSWRSTSAWASGRRCGATTRPLGPARRGSGGSRDAADDANLDLAPWLGAFLDDLLRDLEAEKAAAGAAFGEAHAPGVAALVAAETLKPLAESFAGSWTRRGPRARRPRGLRGGPRGLRRLPRKLGANAGPAGAVAPTGTPSRSAARAFAAGFGEMGSDGATRYGALERRRFAAAVAVGAADCRAALDALPADGLLLRLGGSVERALDRAEAARRGARGRLPGGPGPLRGAHGRLGRRGLRAPRATRRSDAAAKAARSSATSGATSSSRDGRVLANGLPRDASLLADCWAYARALLARAGARAGWPSAWPRTSGSRSRTGPSRSGAATSRPMRAAGATRPFPRTRASRARRRRARARVARARPRRRRAGGAAAEASPLDRVAVDRALDDLAAEASALAFECAFAPVRSALRRVSATRLGGDALKDKAAPYYCRAAVWAGNDDADPAPSDYATVVGEHLMGALRHLEPFLESPAVADAAAVHVDAGGRLTDVREWERIGDVLDADRLGLRALAAGEPLAGAHLGGDALAESSAPPEDADAAARFCSEWLHRLVKATAGALAEELLRVGRVDASGFRQLKADVNYLRNVAKALAVPDHAFLAHLDAVATAAYEGRLPELLLRPMAQTPAAAALASLEAALRAKLDAPVEAAVEAAVDGGAEAPPADEAPPEEH
ncbi:retrograde vesicle-mediated transport protein [Aureococcus anophagefferens]|uniref:Conserved oligomeric Golgi complex subunit 7 n=1 Tax=Aureococcus anophagefferens TaxID=44056 RepID=A0ABR1GEE9_AURAN